MPFIKEAAIIMVLLAGVVLRTAQHCGVYWGASPFFGMPHETLLTFDVCYSGLRHYMFSVL
jgi:hypothetical protein